MAESFPAVSELLPLAGSAVLIDEVRTETEHGVIAAARISRAHRFFSTQQQGVPSWVGIELMAQT
ncbi:MAG: hotdog family protein, partial [Gammaproteobacteria bacterium]